MDEKLINILEEAIEEYYKELPPTAKKAIKEQFVWLLLSR